MARVEGKCRCSVEGEDCPCQNEEAGTEWVDAITNLCRICESTHSKGLNARWGTKVL